MNTRSSKTSMKKVMKLSLISSVLIIQSMIHTIKMMKLRFNKIQTKEKNLNLNLRRLVVATRAAQCVTNIIHNVQ